MTKCDHCGRESETTKEGSCSYCGAPIQTNENTELDLGFIAELTEQASKSYQIGYSSAAKEGTKFAIGFLVLCALAVGIPFLLRFIYSLF